MNTATQQHEYFATCPKHLEGLVLDELKSLGADEVRQTVAGVYFSAQKRNLYRICLWSRLANRILKPVVREKIQNADELYSLVHKVSWESIFSSEQRFVVDFSGTNDFIRNSQFGAQRVKDAIVDRFYERENKRPSIDKQAPDIRINVRISKSTLVVSLDISGESLHKRGYREAQGSAPLKENLAAAIVIRSHWPQMLQSAREKGERLAFIDPMCGSGTLLIEAAMIAANIAPGSMRKSFGFMRYKDYEAELWQSVRQEAEEAILPTDDGLFPFFWGADQDSRTLQAARNNIRSSQLSDFIRVQEQPLDGFVKPEYMAELNGLMVCNPPYGERLGEIEMLREDYQTLGKKAKQELAGWSMGIFTSNPELGREMRLRSKNKYKFFNGTIAAELLVFDLLGGEAKLREDLDLRTAPLSEGAQMVANRLKKNKRKLEPWLKKKNISCYRLYDADMPEYSAAIDVYGDYFHIQEYQATKKIDAGAARRRFDELIHATIQSFNVDPEQVISKTRMRQSGKSQYQKMNDASCSEFFTVNEGQAKLRINLKDYLDSGLFLDHRPLRLTIGEEAAGKKFLNLFCYTATATVHAALGGASGSVSVDMSNTYLEWARENFLENNIHLSRHKLVRSDVLKWLKECREGFDIIMLDPPSFSNSKNTSTVLDIQRDHVSLIRRCMELLNPGGVLYFSNNLRSFKLDEDELNAYKIENISERTIDVDFQRNKRIHQCWKIEKA